MLLNSRIGLSLPVFVVSLSIGVDEILWYVVGRLGGLIYHAGAISSHHIPKAGAGVGVSENSIQDIFVLGVLVLLL